MQRRQFNDHQQPQHPSSAHCLNEPSAQYRPSLRRIYWPYSSFAIASDFPVTDSCTRSVINFWALVYAACSCSR